MAEAVGVAGSIVGIVAFGLQLGVTLQTHIEAAVEASDRLQEIAFEINSTAAVLSQLQAVMKKDCDATIPVFNTDGLRDIKRLSDRCKRIYGVIIILLNEAAEGSENKKLKREVSADGIDDLSLKLNKLGFRRKLAWPWLEPRIKRCQQELRQVKLDLFLHIQVVNLAQYQMHRIMEKHANIRVSQSHPTRAPGSLEEEQALKDLAQELIKKRAMHATKLTRRHTEKTDKAMEVVPTPKVGIAATSPREIICYDRGRNQSEAPPLLATMIQDIQSGGKSEDGPEKPIVGSRPEPDGIETTMESDDTKYHDWKRLRNAVHSVANDFQGPEASSIPPAPHIFSRHIHVARDVATEDEASGTFSPGPSMNFMENGGSRDDEEGSIQRSPGAPPGTTSSPTGTTSSNRMLRFIPNWAHDIFSRGRYGDQKSDKLEAFLIEIPARTDLKKKLALTKLEIGHTHIEAALSATMPRRWRRERPQMWEQYKELDPYVRHEIHHAITLAQQWNNRSRTWIATEFMQSSELDQQGRVHAVLFFRLGDEVEPVSLDTGSRKFILPYEHCRTWEMIERIMIQAFTSTESEDDVRNGKYDIVNNDTGAIIPPRTWRRVLPGPRSRPLSLSTTGSESTSDIDNHELDEEMEGLLGLEEGSSDEIDTSELGLGELLMRWTNAPDAGGNDVISPDMSDR
ncbi:hypothetical protein CEP54_010486 [Fusarium duplospermum]|uniref:Ubiquitin-like domain-containing protein n=1 Tax=Fusarium duplospermum TaxID=1325734 RepID=A0A428PJJ4_9HYPO|nr:hypothetical protein CEP54_010486 [Fusarium duplospermum]